MSLDECDELEVGDLACVSARQLTLQRFVRNLLMQHTLAKERELTSIAVEISHHILEHVRLRLLRLRR